MESQLESIAQEFQSQYALILYTARLYAPTPELVQDVVQQVFIDFMEAAMKGQWDASRDSGPYLRQITKNRAIKHWKDERHKLPEIQRRIGERLAQLQRHRENEPDKENRQLDRLEECTGKLPEKSRQLLELHYTENLTLEAVAERLSMPSSTVRKAMYRIRIQLRDCMEL